MVHGAKIGCGRGMCPLPCKAQKLSEDTIISILGNNHIYNIWNRNASIEKLEKTKT